jgi:hypothetical protein
MRPRFPTGWRQTQSPARSCAQPGSPTIASGETDNHFAEGASLTDMSKRGGHFVEGERTVDVDLYVPCNAERGKRLEVRRPLSDGEDPDCATGESANQPADGEHA